MKSLFYLPVLLMVLLFVHVFTPAVHAADATQLAVQINGISGLTAAVDGGDPNVVKISGNVFSARATLVLNIDAGVTVEWGALYMGSAQPLIALTGDGAFEVGAGSWIYNTGAGNVINASGNIQIVVTGPSVAEGGIVEATSGSAIHCTESNTVIVEGFGSVFGDQSSNLKPVINMIDPANTGENVVIKDKGSVWALSQTSYGYAIQTYGNVRVDGGDVHTESTNGRGINLTGVNSVATINGGRVWATGSSGVAISTANTLGAEAVANASVVVNGGVVSAAGGDGSHAIRTIGTNSTITINGGTVSAVTGYAIFADANSPTSTITVNGGFVFAYAAAPTGSNNVIHTTGGQRYTVGGNGMVVAWSPDYEVYVKGENDDLAVLSTAGATVAWHNDQSKGGGISYENGTNKGFFPLPVGVTDSYGLIFHAADGKMYRDLNGNLLLDPSEYDEADDEYTLGRGITWDGAPGILTLNSFHYATIKPAALIIVGNTTIQQNGSNEVYAYLMGGRTLYPAYYGIYSDNADITIEGDGSLAVSGATEKIDGSDDEERFYYGIKTGGNITINSGVLSGWGLSRYTEAKSFGVGCNQIDLIGGTLIVSGFTHAYENITVKLPGAYTYWTSTDFAQLPSVYYYYVDTLFTGAEPYNKPYQYNAGNQVVVINAAPFAVTSDAAVSGTVGVALTEQTATLTIYGDQVASGGLSGADATGWFTGLPAGISITANAAAGSTSITLTFSGTPVVSGTVLFSIAIPASVLAKGMATYVQLNNNAKVEIADKSVLVLSLSDETVTYTGSPIFITPAILTGAREGAVFIPVYSYEMGSSTTSEALDAGTYVVTAIVAGDDYHIGDTATAMLVVNKATPVISLVSVSAAHTGNSVPVNTPVVTGSATVNSLTLSTIYEGVNGTVYGPTTVAPSDAGQYTVTVSTAGDVNHDPATATATISIDSENPNVSLRDTSKVYDGDPLTVVAYGLDPVDLSITYTYAGTLKDGTMYVSTDQAPTEAGDYTVTAVTSYLNYNSVTVTARLEIQKKQSGITVVDKKEIYNDSPVAIDAPTTNPAGAVLTILYKSVDGTSYPESTTPPTYGGYYEVKAIYEGDNNYLPAQTTALLTITEIPVLMLADRTVIYNGEEQSIGGVVVSPQSAQYIPVTYTYSSAGYPASTTPPVNAGVYSVKATTPADANFEAGEGTATLTIQKAPQTITFDLPADKRLSDAPFNAGASVNTGLPLTYQSGDTDIATIDNDGLITLLQPGVVTFTVSQSGNENYLPASVTRTLSITSESADLLTITVNGQQLEVADNMTYEMSCGSSDDAATVVLTVSPGATVDPGITFVVPLDKPQLKTVTITVTSQDGATEKTYYLTLERRFPFDQIVLMRWNNTLTVINNPANNGGYTFTSYQWYRNGQDFATGQSWSAGANGQELDESDLYYVAVTSDDFDGTLRTCESHVTLNKEIHVTAYPNPVSAGQPLYIRADADDDALEGAVIEVYTLMGKLVARLNAQGRNTPVTTNYPAGFYLFVWKGKNGFQKGMKVLIGK